MRAATIAHATAALATAALGCVFASGASAAGMVPQKPYDTAGSFAACEQRYADIGLPKMKEDGSGQEPVPVCNADYAVSFNTAYREPDWVIERLPGNWVTGKAQRKDNFTADPRVNAVVDKSSATNGDYPGKKIKYDKGHQAPAGDFKYNQTETDHSFWFTNMAPQIGAGFNRNIWKQLETDIRDWVACGGRAELYVVTGPVFDPDKPEHWIPDSGNRRVRVPDGFFKVIYDPAHDRALGMLLPNAKLNTKDLPKYAVAISEIEDKTGIVFFPAFTVRHNNVLKDNASPYWRADENCEADVGE